MTIKKIKKRLSILLENGDYESLIATVLSEDDLIVHSQRDYKYLSTIKFYYAYSYWKLSQIDKAVELIKKSLYYDRTNVESYWLIREMNATSPANKYYRILVNGEWLENKSRIKKTGFYSSYDVVASSEGKALDFIKEYESAPINHSTLIIDEIEELKFDSTKSPSGIYKINGFSLYEIK